MKHALELLYRLSGGLAACSLLAIALIVFTQVAFNLIDFVASWLFGTSLGLLIPSYAQLAGYALGFSTFLSLGLGFRQAAHIRVTLIEGRLPKALQRTTLTLVSAAGSIIAGFIAWSFAHLTWESWLWGDRASGLVRTPIWIPQAVMLFGILVFFIATLHTFFEMLYAGRSDALVQDTALEEAHNE